MGIDDPDLISNLRANVKATLERYEKQRGELGKELVKLETELAELEKDSAELVDQSAVVDVNSDFNYDDSFCAIIEAAKAVSHLVCFPALELRATLLT